MSNFIRSESISVINESLSLPLIDSNAAALIAKHCENQIRILISTSSKISRHCFSVKLGPDHINAALEQLHEAPILTGLSHCKNLDNQSIKEWDLPRFKQASDDVFYVDDPILDFDTLLTTPLPPAPAHIALSLHWLAIEGVQPRIPQNPAPESINQSINQSEDKPLLVPSHVQSSETGLSQFKPFVANLLSKEQQLYFERATEAITGVDPILREATLHSLSNDSGMQQFVPYFVHFLGDEIAHHLRDLRRLQSCLSLAHTLVHSRHLQIEPYLHQLLPSILTCLLGKHLCSAPHEPHWLLRDSAAQLISTICKLWTPIYPTLQSRLTRTFLAAWLDVDRSLPTHYGALKGLAALGENVVKPCVVPYLVSYCTLIDPLGEDGRNPVKRVEAAYVQQALIRMIGQLIVTEITAPAAWALVQAKRKDQSINQSDFGPTIGMDETAKLEAREIQSINQSKKDKKQRKIDLLNPIQARKRAREAIQNQSINQSINQSNLPIHIASNDLPIEQFCDLFGESIYPYLQSANEHISTISTTNQQYHLSHMII